MKKTARPAETSIVVLASKQSVSTQIQSIRASSRRQPLMVTFFVYS